MTEARFQFDIDVQLPDPNHAQNRHRRSAMVIASRDNVEAGVLAYGVGPGQTLRITRMETYEAFRRQGCATQMVQALKAAYPDLSVIGRRQWPDPEN